MSYPTRPTAYPHSRVIRALIGIHVSEGDGSPRKNNAYRKILD